MIYSFIGIEFRFLRGKKKDIACPVVSKNQWPFPLFCGLRSPDPLYFIFKKKEKCSSHINFLSEK
jgi:hypothetical protein